MEVYSCGPWCQGPMLLQELRPRTIIELGAFEGASAVWLADLLDIFDRADASGTTPLAAAMDLATTRLDRAPESAPAPAPARAG